MVKKIFNKLIVVYLTLNFIIVSGCVSVPDHTSTLVGAGVIESVKLKKTREQVVGETSGKGAVVGGVTGGAAGAATGAGFGAVAGVIGCGILAPFTGGAGCAAILVPTVLATSAAGAGVGAIGGAIVGGGGTYLFISKDSKEGLYSYNVLLNGDKQITFDQIPSIKYKKGDNVLVFKNVVDGTTVYHVEKDNDEKLDIKE